MPLTREAPEVFRKVTPDGVDSPTRTPQGASIATSYFQRVFVRLLRSLKSKMLVDDLSFMGPIQKNRLRPCMECCPLWKSADSLQPPPSARHSLVPLPGTKHLLHGRGVERPPTGARPFHDVLNSSGRGDALVLRSS